MNKVLISYIAVLGKVSLGMIQIFHQYFSTGLEH